MAALTPLERGLAEEAPVTSKVAQKEGPYQYAPIPPEGGYIRLVELYPRSSPGAEIYCNLRVVCFDDTCPPYETLSYAWGDESIRATICCGGRPMDVTETLHVVLERLLPAAEGNGNAEEGTDSHESGNSEVSNEGKSAPRLLWIDQLCINQHDKPEKMRQVMMMRDIYRRSTRTVAWLGPSTEESDSAFETLHRISNDLVSGGIKSKMWQDVVKGGASAFKAIVAWNKVAGWAETPAKPESLTAVANLLRRSWFQRMWIIQEACVSPNVVATCGQKEMDLGLMGFTIISGLVSNQLKGKFMIRGFLALSTLMRFRGAHERATPLPLPSLLRETSMFNAGDPRDKIYALYGLTSMDLDAVGLRPDYSLPVEQVYSETLVALLRYTKNLNLLELAGNQLEVVVGLPSWVPSFHGACSYSWPLTNRDGPVQHVWTRGTMRAAMIKALEADGIDIVELGETRLEELVDEAFAEFEQSVINAPMLEPEYAASKKTELESVELEPGGVLRLRGHAVDTVKEASGVLPSPTPDDSELHIALQQAKATGEVVRSTAGAMKSIAKGLRDLVKAIVERDCMVFDRYGDTPYPTGEPLATAYRKTLCAGHTAMTEDEIERAFNKWHKGLRGLKFVNNVCDWNHAKHTSGLGIVMALAFAGLGTGEAALFEYLAQVSSDRRLAWTQRGYLALLPPEAREGDAITVLQGGPLPFVLRSKGGPWQMIGPCYVHGIMDGEAFDEEQCGDVRLV